MLTPGSLRSVVLCSILRKQGYIEDETLTTPEAVTQSILCTNSLGLYVCLLHIPTTMFTSRFSQRDRMLCSLSDLRFQLLQEMLEALPNDACVCVVYCTILVRQVASSVLRN